MKGRWQGFRWVGMLLVLAVASGVCGGVLADYAVELQSPHDTVKFSLQEQSLAVEVTSATGIGRVELTVKKGAQWPESVVLAIRTRDGKPLRELEGFFLSGKAIRINGARRTSGRMDCHEVDPDKPGKRINRREVKVEARKTAKAMEVTIPGALLRGEQKVTIQWIDFYR